jgi:PTH1 family peptidyl-tRNA hydrolase
MAGTISLDSRATPAGATVGAAEAEAGISPWPLRRRKEPSGRADALIVGLGNPGDRYAGTRHNLGFEVAAELSRRWDLPKPRKRYGALLAEGRTGPGGPRVALLLPQTFMNDSGTAAGPARGELGVPLDHVIALHDEIDLPFGEVRSKLGGGVAGHNGLKSQPGAGRQGLGGSARALAGPTAPIRDRSRYVLSRFREPSEDVERLIRMLRTRPSVWSRRCPDAADHLHGRREEVALIRLERRTRGMQ